MFPLSPFPGSRSKSVKATPTFAPQTFSDRFLRFHGNDCVPVDVRPSPRSDAARSIAFCRQQRDESNQPVIGPGENIAESGNNPPQCTLSALNFKPIGDVWKKKSRSLRNRHDADALWLKSVIASIGSVKCREEFSK